MKRKAMQREAQERALDAALHEVYHNATLGDFPKVPEGYEEAAWQELQDYYSCMALADVKAGYVPGLENIVDDYGNVYCYGRGGRTCAPQKWISTRGGSSFNVKSADDFLGSEGYSYGRGWKLIADIRVWNAYVAAECSAENIAAVLEPWIEGILEAKREAGRAEARLRLM